jgi:hypothetical protein
MARFRSHSSIYNQESSFTSWVLHGLYALNTRLFRRLYFAGHITAVLMIVVLPRVLRVHRGRVQVVDDEQLPESTGSSTPHDTPLHMAYLRPSKHSGMCVRPHVETIGAASMTSSDSMVGIRMMSIPPLVDKAIAELPTADPLVSPRHTGGAKRNRKDS